MSVSTDAIPTPQRPLQHASAPHASAPPIAVPEGHVGPVTLPGSGRKVWWTGRVAIGLRHEPPAFAARVL